MVKPLAIVTGGAQGIGFAISSELIKHGYNLAICDINSVLGEEAVEKLKTEFTDCDCCFYNLDISNGNQFKECFLKVRQSQGPISLLINNAGVADDRLDEWENEVNINCKGTVWGCIYGFKYMRKGGTIINIASLTAVVPYVLMPVYSMTKSSIVHITKSFGSQIYSDEFGIKVMAVLPGITDTPILSSHGRYLFPALHGRRNDEFKQYGKPQSPNLVAECVIKALNSGLNGSLWVSNNNQKPQLLDITYSYRDLLE